MKSTLIWLLAAALTGCSVAPISTVQPSATSSDISIDRNSAVCVLVPSDASFEGDKYQGSGREVAEKVAAALEKIGRSARLVDQTYGLSQCKEKVAPLVLQTMILHYEDQATGWSGKPDRIELKLALYEIDRPEQKRTIFYEAKSSTMHSAFFEWGNARPHALLSEDFDHTIRKLLRQVTEQ